MNRGNVLVSDWRWVAKGVLLGWAVWWWVGGRCGAEEAGRPNVVVLIADDLGYGELGCYGGKDVPTPEIDKLASKGVRFTDGYVTAPFCAASRAGLLTGRYQTKFGFEFNPIGAKNEDPKIGLPVNERTLSQWMRDAGYVTSLVGKWHLGGTAAYHPQRRGFDEFFGFLHEGHYFVPPPWSNVTTWLRRKRLPDGSTGRWTSPDGRVVWSTHLNNQEPDYDANNPILRNSQPQQEAANLTDAFTREAESFIERHQQQPFCLVVAYNAVHSPMQGTDEYMAKFAHIPDIHRRIFAAMLAHLDDSVGRIMNKLQACKLEEKTLVVFLSDNGGPTRELTSSNFPLRGEKGQLYEGGIRVPFLMQYPGHLPAGQTDNRPMISLDLLPTILSAAGINTPRTFSTDGVDILPFFSGKKEEEFHPQLYWRVGPKAALRQGDWKLVRDGRGQDEAAWELYNLAQDVGEKKNLSQMQPDRVKQMAGDWLKVNQDMVDPLW